uniref:(northern house mosquito) hypothetical protein n=1 Tax=Culex pipiens TaxID=7175 RepID=A0A8D8A941_CULPI
MIWMIAATTIVMIPSRPCQRRSASSPRWPRRASCGAVSTTARRTFSAKSTSSTSCCQRSRSSNKPAASNRPARSRTTPRSSLRNVPRARSLFCRRIWPHKGSATLSEPNRWGTSTWPGFWSGWRSFTPFRSP